MKRLLIKLLDQSPGLYTLVIDEETDDMHKTITRMMGTERYRVLSENYGDGSYTWKAAGEANYYTVFKDGDWCGNIQLNGKFTFEQHTELMNLIIEGLTNAPLPNND